MKKWLAACIVLPALLVTSCASDGDGQADPEPSAASTSTTEQVSELSRSEACAAVASRGLADLDHLVEFVQMPSLDEASIASARAISAQYAGIAQATTDPVAEALSTVDTEIRAFIDAAHAEEPYELSGFSRASRVLLSECEEQFAAAIEASDDAPAEVTPAEPTKKPEARKKPKPKPTPSAVIVSDGNYEVGRDIPAGTYRNRGGKNNGEYSCVAFASREPNDLTTHLRGTTSKGPGIIRVEKGEYLSVQFCQPFTKD